MKYFLKIFIACFALSFSLSAKAENSPENFFWLVGNWQIKNQDGVFEETWNKPIKDNLTGVSRFVKQNGYANFFELMTLEKNKSHWEMRILHFEAGLKSLHNKPLIYRLIHQFPEKLVFENIGKDSVRYIEYQYLAPTTLVVTLKTNKQKIKEQFIFTRVA